MTIEQILKGLSDKKLLEVLRKLRDQVNSDINKLKNGKRHQIKFNYVERDNPKE